MYYLQIMVANWRWAKRRRKDEEKEGRRNKQKLEEKVWLRKEEVCGGKSKRKIKREREKKREGKRFYFLGENLLCSMLRPQHILFIHLWGKASLTQIVRWIYFQIQISKKVLLVLNTMWEYLLQPSSLHSLLRYSRL